MSESSPNIPPSSQENASGGADRSEVKSELTTSISENDSGEGAIPVSCKIAKPTGLKLPTVTPAARIGRLCNSIPKPAIPPNPATTEWTGVGGGGETMSTSMRRVSDELARKRLTDVDETDENTLPYCGNGKWTPDRKMSSGSVLSDSSRKSDEWRKKRSSDAYMSADSSGDYWKSDFEPRRASDASVILTEDTDQFIIGDRVWVGGLKPGQIAYIGETQFAPGEWAGVVLDEPIGKNDGTVANIRYFQCEPKKGIFSRLTRLTRYPLADGGAGEPAAPRPVQGETRRSNGSLTASVPKKSSLVLTQSTTSKNSLPKAQSPDSSLQPNVQVGDRVIVKSSQGSKAGILRYLGTTDFAAGEWCGVELDDPLGKNDGSVSGTRYFECRPKFGLFAPLHKVSKSPANKRFSQGNCVIHNRSGVAGPGVRRHGSKESLVSLSSTASTAASVRSTNRKVGVRTPTTPTSAKNALQETLKEKELHIEQLLKERDLERAEVTRAASQADEAERRLAALKQELEQQKEEAEARVSDMDAVVRLLKAENQELKNLLDDERRKCEDLQFRFEEEMIEKADMKAMSMKYEEKVRMLEKGLFEERKRAEALEQDSNKLFEAEEQMVMVKDELDSAKEEMSELKKKVSILEQERISLEAQLTSARAEMESLRSLAQEDESLLSGKLGKVLQELEECKSSLERKKAEVEQLREELLGREKSGAEKEKELHAKYLKIINELTAKHEAESCEYTKQLEQLESHAETKVKLLENELEEKMKLCGRLESELSEAQILLSKAAAEKSVEESRQKETEEKQERAVRTIAEELREKKERLVEEMRKCEGLLRENGALREEVSAAQRSLAMLRESSEQKVAALNAVIEEQKEESKKARAEVESEWKEMLSACRKEGESRLQELEKVVMEKKSEAEKLREGMAKAEEEFQVKRRELVQLHDSREESFKSQMKSLEDAEAERRRELDTVRGDVERMRRSLSEREEELKRWEGRTKDLEEKCKKMGEERDRLELESGDAGRRAECLEEKLKQTISQKEKLACDLSEFMKTSSDSSAQLAKLHEELRSKEREMEALIEDAGRKTQCFERAEQELKQAVGKGEERERGLREELERAKRDLEQQGERLKSEVESSNARLRELEETWKKKVESVRGDSAARERDLEERMRGMEEKGAEERNAREDLMKDLVHAREEFRAKVVEVESRAEEEKELLRRKIDEVKRERDGLVQRLEEEKVKLLSSEKERKDIEAHARSSEKVGMELKETAEQLGRTMEELGKVREGRKQLEEEKRELEQARGVLEKMVKELEVRNAELEAQSKSAESESRILKEAMNQLREEKRLLDKDSTGKTLLLNEVRSQLEAVERSRNARDAENEAKIEKLEREAAELRCLLQETEATRSSTVSEKNLLVTELRSEVERVRQECSEMRSEKEKESERANELASELRKEVEGRREEAERREEEVRRVKKEIKETGEELEREKKRCSEYEELVKEWEKERMGLKERLEGHSKLSEETEGLRSRLAEAEKREKEAVREREAEKESLEKMLEATKVLLGEKEKEARYLTEKVEVLKKENEKLESTKESLAKVLEKEKVEEVRRNGNAEEVNQREVQEEREFQKGQVDFLNSVIVDMQKKNDALKARIEILEMGFSPEDVDEFNLHNITTRSVAPRLFCDICDRFDLHDTEDCPTQANEDSPPAKSSKTKVPPPERPYCEICEVFGHDTADCDDGETF